MLVDCKLGRKLPDPTEAWTLEIKNGEAGEWTAFTPDGRLLEELCLPGLGANECLGTGGCFDEDGACELPCDPPSEADIPGRPSLPVAAALPVLTPCPPRWVEQAGICDSRSGLADCPSGQLRLAGEVACVDLDSCSLDEFPDTSGLTPPLVFVRSSTLSLGSGTRVDPYGGLELALRSAPPGATLVLGRGAFAAATIDRDLNLYGTCATETILPSITATTGAVVTIDKIRAGDLVASSGAIVTAKKLIVEQITSRSGARVDVEGAIAGAIELSAGGELTLSAAVVERAPGCAIVGSGGFVATLDDVAIRSAASCGIHGTEGTLNVARTSIEDVAGNGILLAGTNATIRDTSITRVAIGSGPLDTTRKGPGIVLQQGATATIDRTLIDRAHVDGIWMISSTATISDTVVRDTQIEVGGGLGIGIEIRDRSRAKFSRVLAERSTEVGVAVFNSTLTGSDLQVLDVALCPVCIGGEGIRSEAGAVMSLQRVNLERSTDRGLDARDNTSTYIEDLTIRDVARATTVAGVIVRGTTMFDARRVDIRGASYDWGVRFERMAAGTIADLTLDTSNTRGGIGLTDFSELELDRVHITQPASSGIRIEVDSRCSGSDIDVIGGDEGLTAICLPGSSRRWGFNLARARVTGARFAGVVLSGCGSTLRDLIVTGTTDERALGVELTGDAEVLLEEFRIEDNGRRGLRIDASGTLELIEGAIRDHTVGAELPRRLVLTDLFRRVLFERNGQTIEVQP
jgi:hypothetical protein